MLNIDFKKIFSSKPTALTMKAAKAPNKSEKAKKEVVVKTLGDFQRIAHLPDFITEEFVAMYSDTIEEILYPYVAARLLSLGYASQYRKRLVEMIFGSENHLGIYSYLKEKDVDSKSDKEIVHYAETLILKGWQIRMEGEQYWLINGDLNRVMEMTGKAPLFKEVAMLGFDEASAHIFLDDATASKISALAKTLGHDADSLAATGNLDILLAKISDDTFAGYVINYNSLRRILKKRARYKTAVDGITMMDVYKEGYRLGTQLTFPFSEKAIFKIGSTLYSMVPVTDDFNKEYLINKYLLTSIASRVKRDLLDNTGVVSPEVIEIKEFRDVFAVMTELYPPEFSNSTLSENLDLVTNVASANRAGSFDGKVLSNIAALAVVEAILLGNRRFSLAAMSLDTVSGKVFSNHSTSYFSVKSESIETFSHQPYEGSDFDMFSNGVFFADITNPENAGNISRLIATLPEDFRSKLASYELDLTMYPYEFAGIKDYFEKARRVILGE